MNSQVKPYLLALGSIFVGACLLGLLFYVYAGDKHSGSHLNLKGSLLIDEAGVTRTGCSLKGSLLIDETGVTLFDQGHGDVRITRNNRLLIEGKDVALNHRQSEALQEFQLLLHKVVPQIMEVMEDSMEFAIGLMEDTFRAILDREPPEEVTAASTSLQQKFRFDGNGIYLDGARLDGFDETMKLEIKNAIRGSLMEALMPVSLAAPDEEDRSQRESFEAFGKRMERFGEEVEKMAERQATALKLRAEALCQELRQLQKSERKVRRLIPELRDLNLFPK